MVIPVGGTVPGGEPDALEYMQFETGSPLTGEAVGWSATAEKMGVSTSGLIVLNVYSLGWVVVKAFGLIADEAVEFGVIHRVGDLTGRLHELQKVFSLCCQQLSIAL